MARLVEHRVDRDVYEYQPALTDCDGRLLCAVHNVKPGDFVRPWDEPDDRLGVVVAVISQRLGVPKSLLVLWSEGHRL